jgi:hypothetical protein
MNRPMVRPKYETAQDLIEESETAKILDEYFGVSCVKLQAIAYIIDFAMVVDGEIISWAEAKRCHRKFNAKPHWSVSLNKIVHGLAYARATRLPFMVAVKWDDCVGYTNVDYVPFTKMGGRYDRNDPLDIEPMAHFPNEQFQIIKQLKG